MKLHQDYQKSQLEKEKMFQKKTDCFDPKNKQLMKWKEVNSHFQLSEMDKEGHQDIKMLMSDYEGMDIKDVRIIYSSLDKSI